MQECSMRLANVVMIVVMKKNVKMIEDLILSVCSHAQGTVYNY